MARSSAALKVDQGDPEKEPTMGELMNELSSLRKQLAPFEAKMKPIEDRISELKTKLLPLMLKEGLKKQSTKTETISLTETERVKIDDVETMLKALKREGWLHIIDLKVAASKEFAQMKGKEIPGTHTEVVSRSIRVSAIKK